MTASVTPSVATAVAEVLRMNDHLLRVNLDGMAADQAGRQPIDGANSVLWVVGHIAYWRNALLGMTGAPPLWTDAEAEIFKGQARGPAPAVTGWTLDRLMAIHRQVTHALLEGLDALPAAAAADLGKPLRGLANHEAYHVGQVAMLRRALGLPGAV
ncbi:MAG: DinB family protein [Gemmatimonadales bacterium]